MTTPTPETPNTALHRHAMGDACFPYCPGWPTPETPADGLTAAEKKRLARAGRINFAAEVAAVEGILADRAAAVAQARAEAYESVRESITQPHVRASTEHGPDYCSTCSEALAEWVTWPCKATEQARAEAWDEGAESTAEWMANNPGPSGIGSDPPSNPYHRDGVHTATEDGEDR